MRLFVVFVALLTLLPVSGCASTNSSSRYNSQASYDRRKELYDERYDYMRSTGMDYSHGGPRSMNSSSSYSSGRSR